jgi:hypothetical protein
MTLRFNSTDGPIVINDDGVSIGGWEWFESEMTPQIRAAMDRGEIITINAQTAEKNEHVELTFDDDPDEPEPKASAKKK